MAGEKEEEKPAAVDKGKGKAADANGAPVDGEKKKEAGKDGKDGVLPPGRLPHA